MMEPFKLSLEDNQNITGFISNQSDKPDGSDRPLIVAFHGGTYAGSYFNPDNHESIADVCSSRGLRVVCITRPAYGDSSPLPSQDGESSYLLQQSRYLNDIVLPAIWKQYGGAENGTNGVVLYGHSIGGMLTVMVAAAHGSAKETLYPLLGIVSCGSGTRAHPGRDKVIGDRISMEPPGFMTWPMDVKDYIMLNTDMDLCSPSIVSNHANLNNPAPVREITETGSHFRKRWREYAAEVKVPHLNGVPEYDRMLEVSPETLQEFKAGFTNCPRMESVILPSAPHCIELSYVGPEWLKQAIAFAEGCGNSHQQSVEKMDGKL